MSSYNKILLTGKLDKEPEIKETTSGHSLSKFTLIVPRLESLPDHKFDYIQVTAWRENADKSASFKSGDVIFVDGRILTDSYEDSSGKRKWTTSVDAKQVVNFSDVFQLSNLSQNNDSPLEPPVPPISNDSPVENIPIEPINETTFFDNTSPVKEENNDLEEDVPF